jgi:outer membrane biosynthesis protein TonB
VAHNIKVQRPLGMGLDEKAIEAVQQWRFRPGMKDGKPVTVAATLEVNFRPL